MNGFLAVKPVIAAAQAFAIHNQQVSIGQVAQAGHPTGEADLKSLWVQPFEQIPHRIVGRCSPIQKMAMPLVPLQMHGAEKADLRG
mgnify:CR=1 FL=1